MEIKVTVRDKISVGDGTRIVCGNSDYIVRFDLDAEWEQFITRTMIVVNSDKTYSEYVFTGDTVALPVINNQNGIGIGLYAGDLHTTTSAYFDCIKSARCGLGAHAEPNEDVYNQLVQLVENGAVKGEKGDVGPQGVQGERGEKGDKGEKGDSGYTPVKGVDYFDGKDGKDAVIDDTLTHSGEAADAKITGDKITKLKSDLDDVSDEIVRDNLIKPANIEIGYFSVSNSKLKKETNSAYRRIENIKIPLVNDGKVYIRTEGYSKIFFQDSDKTVVSSATLKADHTIVQNVEIPENVAFLSMFWGTSVLTEIGQVFVSTRTSELKNFFYENFSLPNYDC